jgi:hypothetical protein
MNSKINSENKIKTEDELEEDLLKCNQIKINADIEEFEEENLITEFDAVVFLSASKISIKNVARVNSNQKKNKFEKYFEKLPLKGILLATMCAILSSISIIITKLITEFSGIHFKVF